MKRWGELPFNGLNYFFREEFGEKVVKLSLNGGFSCPNRDGTIGTTGCLFCSETGSGEFSGVVQNSIAEQIDSSIELLTGKWRVDKYLAYFQNFSGTYASCQKLRTIYYEALMHSAVCGLAVATRADCIDVSIMKLLAEINSSNFLWIELGLQSMHLATHEFYKTGFNLQVFEEKFFQLKELGIKVVLHLIIGSPTENRHNIFETIDYINKLEPWGVKIHMLHIMRNSPLYKLYSTQPFELYGKNEYIELVSDIICKLKESIVIHRITGDGAREFLEAPLWTTEKKRVFTGIVQYLSNNNLHQGVFWGKDQKCLQKKI